jgi:hypothetical protein
MVRPGNELTAEALSNLGIAIRLSGERQHHIALVYEASDSAVCLSHLLWHRHFHGRDQWDAQYYWNTVAGMHETNRKVVASWLESLAKWPQKIGYGFSSEGCEFITTATGMTSFVSKTPGKGLTCATFILLVFDRLGFQVLNSDSWPQRPDDAVWQAEIIAKLRLHSTMSEEELGSLANDVGSVRFRPIEVAAATELENWPVDFSEAAALADEILAEIAALRFVQPS